MNKNYFEVFHERNFRQISHLKRMGDDFLHELEVVSQVLPFRVNNFVLDHLIDWNNISKDPMFHLTFPQKKMLKSENFEQISQIISKKKYDKKELEIVVNYIRNELNPHPAEQKKSNIPMMNDTPLTGMQHKYKEVVLFFPAQGQTCHTYCTFCFRWAQFVGVKELKFSSSNIAELMAYLISKPDVTDLLLTGGDPMVAKTHHIASYLEPLLHKNFQHIKNIRIGTKSLTYWPYRYLNENEDADQLLRLLEKLVSQGKHVSIMAHYNHWKELEPEVCKQAIKRILATGAVIRSQGPILAHVNDNAEVWCKLWKEQVSLGIIPYYMFVERDTGAHAYFEVPLEKCWNIYRDAISKVSGLCKTARGPSMSATPGKIEIQGITTIGKEKVFVLRFIQARNPEWIQQPFFAKYDSKATWFDQLTPAFSEKFFFQNNILEN